MRISATTMMHSDSGSVVKVTTDRCFYRVAVGPHDVTIIGPGVEEHYARCESLVLNDPDLSEEGAAAIAVIHFEESNQ